MFIVNGENISMKIEHFYQNFSWKGKGRLWDFKILYIDIGIDNLRHSPMRYYYIRLMLLGMGFQTSVSFKDKYANKS